MARLRKPVRELLGALPGWAFRRFTGSTHVELIHAASGARMVVPGTPSDHRGDANAIQRARRLVSQAEAQR